MIIIHDYLHWVHGRVENAPDPRNKATENQPSDIYIEPTKKYRTNHSPQAHSTLKRWGRVGQELGPADLNAPKSCTPSNTRTVHLKT